MTTYDLGAPVTSTWSGAPTGGTVSVSITRPDGTAFTPPTITFSGSSAIVTYVPNMAGRWLVQWASSVKAGAYSDIVDVWPADPKFLISTDDARAALNWPAGNVAADWIDDLRLYIAAATPVIEDIVGAVVTQTFTQVVQRGWSYAALYERPVNSITSIVYSDSTPVTADAYIFDANAGLITFYTPTQDIATVTYTAGTAVIPPNVRLATRELVRHWWQIGKQGTRSGNGNLPQTDPAFTSSGFAVPRRVIELCQAHARPGGFS